MTADGKARLKRRLIGAGFAAFRASGVHRLAARFTRGQGVIAMFHHVRPWRGEAFAPNRLLEITPEFLGLTIETLRAEGFEIVTLDEALQRLGQTSAKPFAVLTFDDGYRDNLQFALPVLRAQAAPFTLYVTSGFADADARLWWLELEEAIRALGQFEFAIAGVNHSFSARSAQEKLDSFNRLYWNLRTLPEEEMLIAIAYLAQKAGVDGLSLTRDLCMRWDEIGEMAHDRLCTIGAHTLTHPMLGRRRMEFARDEMARCKTIIEERLARPVRHFAYPVGDPLSAGVREFALARELGYASAVTTRPGMVFAAHRDHVHALPRLSVN
ncbi:MAG: polysaccharide deacetylase, partial [Alphaproteobacteria bacterium]|nr:polysaccharide deacetylase [Alphaproteobacteria bacterium]